MQAKNETSEHRRPQGERTVIGHIARFVVALAIFAGLAWSLGFSNGEWVIGMIGIYVAYYLEQAFISITNQLNALHGAVREMRSNTLRSA